MDNAELNNTIEKDDGLDFSSFSNQPVFWQLVILLVILIGLFSTAIVSELSKYAAQRAALEDTVTQTQPRQPQAAAVMHSRQPDPLEEVTVLAESAVVWDVRDQTLLYKKNPNDILPLASITKLMTALLANELLTETDDVAISMSDIRQSGESGLSDGEQFDLDDLNNLVLLTSSNDGAHALANSGGTALGLTGADAFVTAMNVRAEQLELDSLQFQNATGLDLSPTTPGAVGSARDVAQLLEYIIQNNRDIIAATKNPSARIFNHNGDYHDAHNTNSTVTDIEGLIGSKTGYTDLAGGNLAIAFEAGLNRPIVIVVLGSTRTGRFEDVLTLTEATRKSLSR